MATRYYNAEISVKDINNNEDVIYPVTKASNVDCTNKIYGHSESSLTNLQDVINSMSDDIKNSITSTGGIIRSDENKRILEIAHNGNGEGDALIIFNDGTGHSINIQHTSEQVGAIYVLDSGKGPTMYLDKTGELGRTLTVHNRNSTDYTALIKTDSTNGAALCVENNIHHQETLALFNNQSTERTSAIIADNLHSVAPTIMSKVSSNNNYGLLTDGNIIAKQHAIYASENYRTNKKSITDTDAKKLLQLKPIYFDYKSEYGGGTKNIGLNCQEVQDLIPELIVKPADFDSHEPDEFGGFFQPMMGIDYSLLTPFLIKLCQIQQDEIDQLKTQVAELSNLVHAH